MVAGAPTIMCKWRNVVNFSAWNAKKTNKKKTKLCMANLSFGLTYSSKMDLASQCQGPFYLDPFHTTATSKLCNFVTISGNAFVTGIKVVHGLH